MPVISPTVPNCAPCNCTPYENLCCCPPINGISVMQPKCQLLPPGFCGEAQTVSNNPCHCQANDTSFWTFKFFTDCAGGSTNAISHFVIPICEDITEDDVRVFLKVDTCGSFTQVPAAAIDIKKEFQQHGIAPDFFNWLKVDNTGLFEKGVCVTYLIAIKGNFQVVTGAVQVFAGGTNNIFNCQPSTCFHVPGCIPSGNLVVDKNCSTVVNDANNTAVITYNITVINPGPSTVTNITFTDTQTVPAGADATNVAIISPPTPPGFSAAFDGTVVVTGNVASLAPGASFTVRYAVTFVFTAPGTFNFTNTAVASGFSNGIPVSGRDSSTCTVFVRQIRIEKCCLPGTSNCDVVFRIRITNVGASTATSASITDQVTIPAGVTVRFLSANYVGCTLSVPTDTDITGAAGGTVVTITCNNVPVPSDRFIRIRLVSVACCETRVIQNRVTAATPNVNTANNEISLPTQGLPAVAAIDVQCCATCQSLSTCLV